jgi:biopolymer transport protein ExbB
MVAAMFEQLSNSEFLAQGGLIIAVILAGSLLAGSVFVARLLVLQRGRITPARLSGQVRDLIVREEFPQALTLCRMDDSPMARLYLAGLRQRDKPREVTKELMLEVGRHEAILLGRGLPVLDVVAVISPLLGLLGTVWGMIAVFQAIEVHGVGNAGALAGGIETALYTTFAGLLVAIPVRVAHSFLQSRVDGLIMHMEELALEFLDLVSAGSRHTETAEP